MNTVRISMHLSHLRDFVLRQKYP